MATVNFWLDCRRPKADGRYPLKIRISSGKLSTNISTDESFSPEEWKDTEKLLMSFNGRRSLRIKTLYERIQAVRRNISRYDQAELEAVPDSVTLKNMASGKHLRPSVKSTLPAETEEENTPPPVPRRLFLEAMSQYAESAEKEGTRMVYRNTILRMQDYDPGADLLEYEDVDPDWIRGYRDWLAKKHKPASVEQHLRNIKAVYNWLIDNYLVAPEHYPFKRSSGRGHGERGKISIVHQHTPHAALSLEEMRRLVRTECDRYQNWARDLFVLSFCLAGVNPADLIPAEKGQFADGRFRYRRSKTGKPYDVKITEPAERLLKKYRSRKGRYALRWMDDWKDYRGVGHHCNDLLKTIGTSYSKGRPRYGTPLFPRLSLVWARRTFASIAIELKIDPVLVGGLLGHSWGRSASVTEIYVDIHQKNLDEALEKIVNAVFDDADFYV